MPHLITLRARFLLSIATTHKNRLEYYQPHPLCEPANPLSYDNMYYTPSEEQVGNHAYDPRCGYYILNVLFDDVEPHQFDPNFYAPIG
jgi:hypothetical protein